MISSSSQPTRQSPLLSVRPFHATCIYTNAFIEAQARLHYLASGVAPAVPLGFQQVQQFSFCDPVRVWCSRFSVFGGVWHPN